MGQLVKSLCAFSLFAKLEIIQLFSFFNLGLLTHLKMELIFLDEGCDVFMIENAIKLDEKN
jgi:hypothetical protein